MKINVTPLANSVAVDPSKLTEVGLISSGFSIRPNETIEFADDEPQVFARAIQGTDAKGYYLAVMRNGKPGFINIADLVRVDSKNQPVDELRGKLRAMDNLSVRYDYLKGKTATAGKVINYMKTNFVDGRPSGEVEAHTYELTLSE